MWLRKVVSSHTKVEIHIKDVIAADPQLDWFWPQVKDAVIGERMPLT